MRILIGTPIHVTKDYSMERWLKNVSESEYPADLLMVDDSPGRDYVKKVEGYCKKIGIRNYKIKHLDTDPRIPKELRIEIAQEAIAREVWRGKYDAWFSWESDHLIPPDALSKLVKLIKEDVMLVIHGSVMRAHPESDDYDMGITLVRRDALELGKNWFSSLDNINLETDDPGFWKDYEAGFLKERVLDNGGNYVEINGLIGPVEYLNDGSRD